MNRIGSIVFLPVIMRVYFFDMVDEQKSRQSRRDSVFRGAMIRLPGVDTPLPARVRDVSDCGARIDFISGLQVGMCIEIAIGAGCAVMAKVAWIADGKCGVAFDHAQVPAAAVPAVHLDGEPTAGWMADMRNHYRS